MEASKEKKDKAWWEVKSLGGWNVGKKQKEERKIKDRWQQVIAIWGFKSKLSYLLLFPVSRPFAPYST